MIELTALVLYAIIHDDSETKKKGVIVSRDEAKALDELREMIQLKPYKDYDAPMVAESLNMSVSKLNRAFRSVYGTSLHSYVQEMRLEHAARLLLDGYNVTESATRSGYNNMSYFARAFKERFNVRPKRFRERKMSEKEL
jgi:AraC-like DNA-binding protein